MSCGVLADLRAEPGSIRGTLVAQDLDLWNRDQRCPLQASERVPYSAICVVLAARRLGPGSSNGRPVTLRLGWDVAIRPAELGQHSRVENPWRRDGAAGQGRDRGVTP